jgi:glutaredoxin
MKTIKVYGVDWCGDTRRTLQHLDAAGVKYDYINVDNDQTASDLVKQLNGGKELKPTIDLNGNILSVPSNAEIDQALDEGGATD